jgi:hypothetical protein
MDYLQQCLGSGYTSFLQEAGSIVEFRLRIEQEATPMSLFRFKFKEDVVPTVKLAGSRTQPRTRLEAGTSCLH